MIHEIDIELVMNDIMGTFSQELYPIRKLLRLFPVCMWRT